MDLCFIKCIRVFSPGESGRSGKLATDFHLVPNLRISAAVTPIPHSFQGVCWEKFTLFYRDMKRNLYIFSGSVLYVLN